MAKPVTVYTLIVQNFYPFRRFYCISPPNIYSLPMFLSKRVAATQRTWTLLALRSSRPRLLHSSPEVATPSAPLKSDKFIFDKHVNTIRDITGNYESLKDKTVTLNGWIDKKPKQIGKDLIFATLRDIEGNKIQLVGSESLLKGLNTEDVVQVQGRVNTKRAPRRGACR